MSEEFRRRYKSAVSQNNAAKRRNRYRKRDKWSKYSPGGVVKYPSRRGEHDEEDHEDGQAGS